LGRQLKKNGKWNWAGCRLSGFERKEKQAVSK